MSSSKLLSLAQAATLLGITGSPRARKNVALRRLRAIEVSRGVVIVLRGEDRKFSVDVGALRRVMPALFDVQSGPDPEIIAQIVERFAVFESRDRELHERGNILADAIVKLTERVDALTRYGTRRY